MYILINACITLINAHIILINAHIILINAHMIGWEYCLEPEMGAWNPFERNHHHTRRRRWVRIRTRILDASIVAKKKVEREREEKGRHLCTAYSERKRNIRGREGEGGREYMYMAFVAAKHNF